MNSINVLKNFWAKKNSKKGFKWLSLYQHLTDTVCVADRLWELYISPGQKKIIIDSIKNHNFDKNEVFLRDQEEDIAKGLVKFIAAVHDIAKATPVFVIQPGYSSSPDLDKILIEKIENSGFPDLHSLILASPGASHHTVAGQYILNRFEVNESIASIVGSHHGKPLDQRKEYENQEAYLCNIYQSENKGSEVFKRWDNLHHSIINRALDISGFKCIAELPILNIQSQVILSGLIIMADWIASNDEYFPLVDVEYELNEREISQRDEDGWRSWFTNYIWEPDCPADSISAYKSRFKFGPREVQSKVFDVVNQCEDPGIVIFEAPMGLGKTEAALIAAEQLANKKGCGGLFFGLPTQATSNGIFPRIIKWLENTVDENHSIRLQHGKAALNPEFYRLSRNIDEDGEGSIFVNQWFAGRKTSALDEFVVGTVDQFLLASLKQKHLALRHLGFSKKVVIIDEVHAYDAYMSQYLNRSLLWMGAYDIPVILLSATLPNEKRVELIRSYLTGKYPNTRITKDEFKEISGEGYPIITFSDGSKPKIFTDFNYKDQKEILIEYIDNDDEFSNVFSEIDELRRQSNSQGIFGIIVNTVRKAQSIGLKACELYGEENVEILHSGYISDHRIKKEEYLMKIIGKDVDRPDFKIVIGTQVIEQSLDIDFDVLFTDLAPIDLVLQRAGRLHRHSITRPKGFENPTLYVIGCNDKLEFDKGSNAVYGEYLLSKTQTVLKSLDVIRYKDLHHYVSMVYDEDNEDFEKIRIDSTTKSEIEKQYVDFIENIKDYKLKAHNFILSQPKQNKNLIGWLKNSQKINSENDERRQVRYSDGETISVLVVKKNGEGYGIVGNDSTDVSLKISEQNIAKQIARQSLNLPRYFTFNIQNTIDELESFNKEYLKEWQNQSFLKGELGIIIDECNEFELCGKKIMYSEKLGIVVEGDSCYGKI